MMLLQLLIQKHSLKLLQLDQWYKFDKLMMQVHHMKLHQLCQQQQLHLEQSFLLDQLHIFLFLDSEQFGFQLVNIELFPMFFRLVHIQQQSLRFIQGYIQFVFLLHNSQQLFFLLGFSMYGQLLSILQFIFHMEFSRFFQLYHTQYIFFRKEYIKFLIQLGFIQQQLCVLLLRLLHKQQYQYILKQCTQYQYSQQWQVLKRMQFRFQLHILNWFHMHFLLRHRRQLQLVLQQYMWRQLVLRHMLQWGHQQHSLQQAQMQYNIKWLYSLDELHCLRFQLCSLWSFQQNIKLTI